MEEVRRRTSLAPLASPCFVLCLIRVETEGLLDFQGRAGITSIARWNLCLVIFSVENSSQEKQFSDNSCCMHCRGLNMMNIEPQW